MGHVPKNPNIHLCTLYLLSVKVELKSFLLGVLVTTSGVFKDTEDFSLWLCMDKSSSFLNDNLR